MTHGAAETSGEPVRDCLDCGCVQLVPALSAGEVARCHRCHAMLRHQWRDSPTVSLALMLSAAVALLIGATGRLAIVEAAGQIHSADLLAGPIALAEHGLWELSVLVSFTTIVAPAALTALTIYVLAGIRLQRPPPYLRQAFRLRQALRPWAMIEVFLVGYFVAFAKLGALAQIRPGVAIYALFGFMVATVAVDAILDRDAVWDAIASRDPRSPPDAATPARAGSGAVVACRSCKLACDAPEGRARCPRCHSPLETRKPDSLTRTTALGLAALVLYVPANVFPVLTVVSLGRGSPSTILGGVWELLGGGELPLAIIVFTASIAVPVLKLMGLSVMVVIALRGRSMHLRQLTMLYRVISVIGRWSMIDIFMEAILSGLVQFGAFATIDPGAGALAFASVVVLTIFAAESFDPRLMWDRVA